MNAERITVIILEVLAVWCGASFGLGLLWIAGRTVARRRSR